MDVWALSAEANAAVFMEVLYGNILAIATLIRPNRQPNPHQRLSLIAGGSSPARLRRRQLLFVLLGSLSRERLGFTRT